MNENLPDVSKMPDQNLIQQQRYPNSGGNLDYSNSPSPEKTLKALDMTLEDLPGKYTEQEIMDLTPAEARGHKMLRMAEEGKITELIPIIREQLVAGGATKEQFDRLECFEKYNDPKKESSKVAAMLLSRDANNLRTKMENELTKTPPGQLDYSEVKPGINLQPPNTNPYGLENNSPAEIPAVSNTEPGMLAY